MYKTIKINNIEIINKKDKDKKINLNAKFFGSIKYCILLCIGATGSGKSFAINTMINEMVLPISLVYLLSSTYLNTPYPFNSLINKCRFFYLDDQKYENDDNELVKDTLNDIQENNEYADKIVTDYENNKNDEFENQQKNINDDIQYKNAKLIQSLDKKYIYLKNAIIIDDMMIYLKNKSMSFLSTRVRHYKCSLFFLFQNYTNCSTAIRSNVNILMLFYGISLNHLKTIYEDKLSGIIKNFNTFYELYNSITSDKKNHQFLYINLIDEIIMKGFNEQIILQ